jgi:hypothetical protein
MLVQVQLSVALLVLIGKIVVFEADVIGSNPMGGIGDIA